MPGRLMFAVAAALLLGACGDKHPFTPGDSGGPQAVVIDGSTGNNPHFYFLEPLVKNSSGGTGVFNPNLSPTVVVCEYDAGACGAQIAEWTRVSGPGTERVQRVRENGRDFYMQVWKASQFPARVGQTYRVTVLLGETALGSLDIRFYETPAQQAAALAENVIPFPWDPNFGVPIRFSVEQGALAYALGVECAVDCVEAAVMPGVHTVITTPSKTAGVEFGTLALKDGEPINVSASKVVLQAGEKCLPTDLQQFGNICFRVNVDRDIRLDPNTVVVGVCLNTASAGHDNLALYKVEEDANGKPVGEVIALEQRRVTFLDCSSVAFNGSDHPLARFARAGLRALQPMAALVGPTRLYAYDLGMGCDPVGRGGGGDLLDGPPFSRFGWTRPLVMTKVAGDGQVAPVGSTLLPPTVLLRYEDHHGVGEVAPGVAVRFTFSGPGIAPYHMDEVTDNDGIASANWVLGAQVGTYTVTVRPPPYKTPEEPGKNIANRLREEFTAEATPGSTDPGAVEAKLLHRWTGDGTYNDAIGTAHGTPVPEGTVGFGTGRIGQAFLLDGASHVSLGTAASLSGSVNFSLEAWVQVDAASSGERVIIAQHGASSAEGGYILGINAAGQPHFSIRNGGLQWQLTGAALSPGSWHHIVAVRHGARGYLYVNGALSRTESGGVKHLIGTVPANIGAKGGSGYFAGLIDHVGIYGQALRAAEVSILCNCP
jgi:hypothetical protein